MLGVREREKLPLEFSEPGRALRKENLSRLEFRRDDRHAADLVTLRLQRDDS
jgi:hypothetical protein